MQNVNREMDIVKRLKTFMSLLNIANSQFADTCRIPRPTVSQILNGRNKKISDELISKIHDAYPQLSVLWLMFGEGDMLIDSNIKISELKTGDSVEFGQSDSTVNEPIIPGFDFESPNTESNSENFSMSVASKAIKSEENIESEKVIVAKPIDKPTTMSLNTSALKKVIEIRVFYNDNSYEIFVPQERK